LVKFHKSVQAPMISERKCRHAEGSRACDQLWNFTDSIEKRIMGVDVQMHE